MKTIYENVPEIVTFFNKAQNKIAQLSTLLASEAEDEDHKRLLLDLSDFIESLDSTYCYFSISDTLRYIQFWNRRANLTSIPFIQITDYVVDITGCTPDFSGIEDTVREILSRYPHNSLASIQGGSSTEKYHLTKAQLDWIDCQMARTPCPDRISSTVTLTLTPNRQSSSYGFFELGTTVTLVNLQGHINYGTEKKAVYYEYLKNSSLLGTRNTSPAINEQPNVLTQTNITENTTFSFSANFSISGLKTDTKSISFAQPMYYGLIRRDDYNNVSLLVQGSKLIKDKGELIIDYDIPNGNTLITDNSYVVPFIFFPGSWTPFTTAFNGIFDFRTDWKDFGLQMPLANNTTMDGILSILDNQIEGLNTFKITW